MSRKLHKIQPTTCINYTYNDIQYSNPHSNDSNDLLLFDEFQFTFNLLDDNDWDNVI